MDMMLFASRLKEVRESRNISAEDLAEAVGVNKATIHRYERGDFKSVKQNRLELIAEFLNVSKSYLTGDSDSKYYNETIKSVFEIKPKELDEIVKITTDLLTQDGIVIEGKPVDKDSISHLIKYMEYIVDMNKKDKEE